VQNAFAVGLAVGGSISESIRDRSGGRQTNYLLFLGQGTRSSCSEGSEELGNRCLTR